MLKTTKLLFVLTHLALIGVMFKYDIYAQFYDFQQLDNELGLVVMEAENYSEIILQSNTFWQNVYEPENYSGLSAMRCMPDTINYAEIEDALAYAPYLNYTIWFIKADTVYIWARAYHTGGGDDSFHAGIDGEILPGMEKICFIEGITNVDDEWQWMHKQIINDYAAAKFYLKSPGKHVFQVYMRESGFMLDKIVLTTSKDYIPVIDSIKGPPETPLIIIRHSICIGGSIKLDALLEGSSETYSFSWTSNPPGFVSSIYNPLVTPDTSTIYSVKITDNLTGTSFIKLFKVDVFPLPDKPEIMLKGDNILICIDSGMYSYNWYYEDNMYQNEHKQFLSFNNNLLGNYYVEVVNANLCKVKSNPYFIGKKSGNLVENNAPINLYPIPGNGLFVFSVMNFMEGPVTLLLYDLTGKTIERVTFYKHYGIFQTEIDFRHLSKGFYILETEFNKLVYKNIVIIQ